MPRAACLARRTRAATSAGLSRHWLEHLESAKVPPEGLGYDDRAVGLLVGLEDGDDPPGGGQGTVERRNRRGPAVLGAVTDVETTRLEGRAVRRRGELAVGLLRGHPRLDVVLARGARAEIAGGGVDDAIAQAERLQHLLLPAEEPLVLGFGLGGGDIAEHLELVELMHADDAPGVFAVAARLAAIAGRPAG